MGEHRLHVPTHVWKNARAQCRVNSINGLLLVEALGKTTLKLFFYFLSSEEHTGCCELLVSLGSIPEPYELNGVFRSFDITYIQTNVLMNGNKTNWFANETCKELSLSDLAQEKVTLYRTRDVFHTRSKLTLLCFATKNLMTYNQNKLSHLSLHLQRKDTVFS